MKKVLASLVVVSTCAWGAGGELIPMSKNTKIVMSQLDSTKSSKMSKNTTQLDRAQIKEKVLAYRKSGVECAALINAIDKENEKFIGQMVRNGGDINQPIKIGDQDKKWIDSLVNKYSARTNSWRILNDIGIFFGQTAISRVNKENIEIVTPLFLAYICSKENAIRCLKEHGANFKNHPDLGGTILFLASGNGKSSLVKDLVELGANVNFKGCCNESPLTVATANGHNDTVKYLIEHGADVNHKNSWGVDSLRIAIEERNDDIAKYMIDNCDVDKEDALILAVTNGRLKLVKHLIEEKKIDVNTSGKYPPCNSLIHSAILGKNKDVAKYLVKHGANVNKENGNGDTPLSLAYIFLEDEGTIKYLIEHGADINKKPILVWAAKDGNGDMVKYLIEHGADVNKEDINGYNSLYWARENNDEDLVGYLKGYGAHEQTAYNRFSNEFSDKIHNFFNKTLNPFGIYERNYH